MPGPEILLELIGGTLLGGWWIMEVLQNSCRLKKKMERQLHHTSDGSAIITNTPPQPQDGKTMVMAQIHPCWFMG
ncbi:uncharacterized protein LOC131316183 isoform X5 [Rhododendron vialii]|uniref:uncharacterized protein LOC131316183 isoform X5 n=1 Tax=Rhododendron vialii TaxID=182163 RepID=UPI0026602887|nr:uncharacterized protein LOC131316183 isoform X5 [Rhododendron vialii]